MEFRKNLLAALLASATIMPMYGDNIKDNVTLPEMGTITGRITDADRQVLPGATIMIEELHTGVTSDVNGFYTLANLKPGTYKVKVSYVGYEVEGGCSDRCFLRTAQGIADAEGDNGCN